MNKIVFITGATAGIGKACAEKFAANNYSLILNGRREDRLLALANELTTKYTIEVLPLAFDVSIAAQVTDAINSLPEKWQNISLLINNAGLALGRDYFEEAELSDWNRMIDTNIKGVMYVAKAIVPLMVKVQQGHIINIGSIAGKDVYEKGNMYCATKHAVDALSHAMRIDLLRHNIKVTAVHPGAAETEFSLVRFKGDEEMARNVYTGMQPLSGNDIADTVFYCTTLPPHVCINDLVITCTQQADSFYSFRKS